MTSRSRRPRVVLWDNVPSPYGVEQYNLLADRGNLDVSVWFSARTEPGRSWDVDEAAWRFPAAYIENPSQDIGHAHRFVRRCHDARPDVVVAPYGERGFFTAHAILKAIGIRTALAVQPTFDAWVHRTWWKEMAKAVLFHSAEAAQVPGPDGARYARRYGFPEDRIFPVRMTTNVQHFARGLSAGERRSHRAQLGVDGCVFLYVGRLWKGKGLLCLIDAFRQARLASDAISLLLIGDGPDEKEIRAAADGIQGVTFKPFVQAAELPACYAAADVFVFPTLGDPHGQVIEEAHAAGLPIVTSDAVGDVHLRVSDGANGFVVPAGDGHRLTHRMLELAADPDLRACMGGRGAARARMWGHEVYASDVEAMARACLAAPRRATWAALGMSTAGHVLTYMAGAARRTFHRQVRKFHP